MAADIMPTAKAHTTCPTMKRSKHDWILSTTSGAWHKVAVCFLANSPIDRLNERWTLAQGQVSLGGLSATWDAI